MKLLQETITRITGLDHAAMQQARARVDYLLKPPGSLGKLEEIAVHLAGISGKLNNCVDRRVILVFGGDNGVLEEGVSSYPASVSLLVAQTMVKGISGVAVLGRHAGAKIRVVDLGLAGDVTGNEIINRKITYGTGNIARGPAMTRDEAVKAIETGIETAHQAIDDGAQLLGTGEIGIGNTTTSSAVLYALTRAEIDILVGRGAGLTDEALEHKKLIVRQAVEINKPDSDDPVDVLAKVGGFDLAGLAGAYLGAAERRVPIVIDGFISGVAAVCAMRIKPEAKNFMIPSHQSEEPGARLIAEILGMRPPLFMNMRLGEGTGCALMFPIIAAAVAMMNEMGTFGDIGM